MLIKKNYILSSRAAENPDEIEMIRSYYGVRIKTLFLNFKQFRKENILTQVIDAKLII